MALALGEASCHIRSPISQGPVCCDKARTHHVEAYVGKEQCQPALSPGATHASKGAIVDHRDPADTRGEELKAHTSGPVQAMTTSPAN